VPPRGESSWTCGRCQWVAAACGPPQSTETSEFQRDEQRWHQARCEAAWQNAHADGAVEVGSVRCGGTAHESNQNKGSIYMVFEYMDHDLTGLADRPGMRFTVPQVPTSTPLTLPPRHTLRVSRGRQRAPRLRELERPAWLTESRDCLRELRGATGVSHLQAHDGAPPFHLCSVR
jgi:hypothetical protein